MANDKTGLTGENFFVATYDAGTADADPAPDVPVEKSAADPVGKDSCANCGEAIKIGDPVSLIDGDAYCAKTDCKAACVARARGKKTANNGVSTTIE